MQTGRMLHLREDLLKRLDQVNNATEFYLLTWSSRNSANNQPFYPELNTYIETQIQNHIAEADRVKVQNTCEGSILDAEPCQPGL